MEKLSQSYYDSRFREDAGRDRVWPPICRYLERDIPSDASVLDLGAGYCSFINHVRAGKKFAVDIHDGVKGFAAPDVDARIQSCENLRGFRDGSMDVVFASNLFEHLDDAALDNAAREVRRVLKEGGRFILMQPNFRLSPREYFDDYTHKKIFTDISLTDYIRARGFRIRRVEPGFLPMSMRSRLPKCSWLVSMYLALPFRPFAKQMLVIAEK